MADINIQWFPGHMTKTKRLIEADIKLVDAVAELTDARCPEAGRNPVLDKLIAGKPRVILLNKADYADEAVTKKWITFYKSKGYLALSCDCRSGKGVKSFVPLLKTALSDVLEKRRNKGMVGRSLRVMVVGIPNVGKSSFINRLAGSRKTAVGDKPGVTRGKQWVTIDKEVELLDMPGILWPKFDDPDVALKLAFTGAIKDEIMDTEGLAEKFGRYLMSEYPSLITARYKLEKTEYLGEESIIEEIARKRGMFISGGKVDTLRAAVALLDEFRGGKIGRITLEQPK